MADPQYIIEFDDGTSESIPFTGAPSQAKLNAARQQATQRWMARQKAAPRTPPAAPAAPPEKAPASMGLGDYIDSVRQGATFNLSDEYDAAIDTLAEKVTGVRHPEAGDTGKRASDRGWGEAWSAIHKQKNDRLRDVKDDNFWKATAAEMVGALPQTLLVPGMRALTPGGGATGFARNLARGMFSGGGGGGGVGAANYLKDIGRGVLGGAGSGGLSAIGASEGGAGDRASAGAAGATVGGTVGGAIPALSGAVRRGLQWGVNFRPDSAVSNALQRMGGVGATSGPGRFWNAMTGAEAPQNAARQKAVRDIVDALRKNRLTLDQAEEHLTALGEGAFPADLVPDLAGTSMRYPSAQKETVTQLLNRRDAEAGERLGQATREATGGIRKNAGQIHDMLTEQQQTTANAAYNQLWRQHPGPVTSPNINEILERPGVREIYQSIRRSAQTRGGTLPEQPTLQMLDNVKKQLWHEAESATNRGTVYEADLKAAQEELVGWLDHYYPNYEGVRRQWGDPQIVKNAMEAGEGYKKLEPAQITARLAELGPVEQQAFRTGAIKQLYETMDETKGTRAIYNSLSRGEKDRLAALFPSDDAMYHFMAQVQREKVFKRTQQIGLGGSQTAEREAQKKTFEADTTMDLIDALRAGKPVIGTSVGIGAQKMRQQALEDKASETLGLLYNPVQGLGTVRRVQEQMDRRAAARPKLFPSITGRAVGSAIGGKIGR